MNLKYLLLLSALLALLAGCSNNNDAPDAVVGPALELNFVPAPIELPGISASFARDVRYGDAERNLFDVYLPECDGPTPLVIYIHGGGFTGGDKSGAAEDLDGEIREFLQSCIAFAAINYTLLEVPADEADVAAAVAQGGVLTSLRDTARALQFMRYHYRSLNIQPENVAAFGGSAGAGSSLWLGTHDDMADPSSTDPVLRESTRLKAVGALATQSTYNLVRWEEILLPITQPLESALGGTDLLTLAKAVGATNYLFTFLGVSSAEEIESPDNIAYRAEVDLLALMDSGDAPVFVRNFETGLDDVMNMFLHHALHGLAVKERADEVGLESVAYSDDPAYPLVDPSGESLVSFLSRHIR